MQIVYGLEDQRDGLFHYVGITDDVYTRFNDHVRGSGGNIEKNGWIFECRKANSMIMMHEFERIEKPSKEQELVIAHEREKYWVRHYLVLGHPLSNISIAQAILKEQAKQEEQLIKTKAASRKEKPALTHSIHTSIRTLDEIFVIYRPGMSHRALAQLLGVSHPTAGKYIQRLRNTGMIS